MTQLHNILDSKAKPPGSLGVLESWAAKLASIQITSAQRTLSADPAVAVIFCADHGTVTGKHVQESVSAYPQAVSAKIFAGLTVESSEAAAGAVLAAANGFSGLYVVDVGLNCGRFSEKKFRKENSQLSVRVFDRKIKNGTQCFSSGNSAMTLEECKKAVEVGREIVRKAVEEDHIKVTSLGEVGIGNTTSAAAIVSCLTGKSPEIVCGRGTGLDDDGLKRKIHFVEDAIANFSSKDPMEVLMKFGGFEIAAMVGCILECLKLKVAVIVDGFITGASALVAYCIEKETKDVMFFSHNSEEIGMKAVFDLLEVQPILQMNLRLGEGTGAILAYPILRSAAAMFNEMITLEAALALPLLIQDEKKCEIEADLDATRAISKSDVSLRGTGTSQDSSTDTYEGFSLYSETRVFFSAMMFLTRLPCPSFVDHHPAFLLRSMAYYPLIGCIIGLFAAVFWKFAFDISGSYVLGSIFATGSSVWLTGCFHEDGLTDTFDGFGGGWNQQQILRIMQDSRVGTYGMVGTVLWIATKIYLLCLLQGDAWTALIAGHCIGRLTSLPMVYSFPYLVDPGDSKGGLYNKFAGVQNLLTSSRMAFGVVSAGIVGILCRGLEEGLLSVIFSIIVAMVAGLYGESILGGVVGDFLGASICVSEVSLYFVFYVLNTRFSITLNSFVPLGVTFTIIFAYIKMVQHF